MIDGQCAVCWEKAEFSIGQFFDMVTKRHVFPVQFCSFYCAEYLFCIGADNYHCYECMGKIWIKNNRMRSHTSIEDELAGLI